MHKLKVSIAAAILLAGFSSATPSQKAVGLSNTNSPRIEKSLNAGWRFTPTDQKGFEARRLDDSAWLRVNVPHTWNDKDAFDETPGYRRGLSWYRKEFAARRELAGKILSVYFEGANQVAEVYVNGRFIGKHIGGYTAFSFDITDAVDIGKPNVLAVRVDNSFNEDIPPLTADFNMYGGIYRDVRLVAVDKLHIKNDDLASSGVQISTPGLTAAGGTVVARGSISNMSGVSRSVDVESRVTDAAGRTVASAISKLSVPANGESTFENSTRYMSNPHLWSPDDPYLYRVRISIRENGSTIDSVAEPLGFRWFRFDPENGFYLNGKPLKLRGTNRHQDYKDLGNALPDRLHVRDLELIKDTGFNFLRLAHYPQDPSVLEAADRLGLLLWEEIPIVNYITDSKAFADNSAVMLREMIRQHRNHPSVIMWGFMNEIYLRVPKGADNLYPATVTLARELNKIAHAEDITRSTTMALHGSEVYNTAGLADVTDVIGWNLYSGWYSGQIDGFGKFLDDQHRRFPKRPLIVSEYGANGDQRLHSNEPRRFDSTTEYQRRFHESYLSQIDARPYISGSAIWSQFDFGSEYRGETIPHVNQKGMFTSDRRPKDINYFYKASLSPAPVLHIAANDQKYRSGLAGSAEQIDVYTNLAEAELIVNGVSAGRKSADGGKKITWNVQLQTGANDLLVRGKGKAAISDRANIDYKPISATSPDIAVNIGSNANFTDADNVTWLADRPYVKGGWGFSGKDAKYIYSGTDDRDILGTSDEPLLQTMQQGLTGYKFDVPAGEYTVELKFAETKFPSAGKRIFDVKINGNMFLERLDLAQSVGINRAFSRQSTVSTTGGISIEFVSHSGEPVVSAIRIRRSTKGPQ